MFSSHFLLRVVNKLARKKINRQSSRLPRHAGESGPKRGRLINFLLAAIFVYASRPHTQFLTKAERQALLEKIDIFFTRLPAGQDSAACVWPIADQVPIILTFIFHSHFDCGDNTAEYFYSHRCWCWYCFGSRCHGNKKVTCSGPLCLEKGVME